MITFNYCLSHLPFECVNQIKDLWFLYVSTLHFRPHIDYIGCKVVYVLDYTK